jgi:DUF1365 family protein
VSLASAVYEGTVRHRRSAPTAHRFQYRLFMMYLDLAELPELFDSIPLWSARRPAPARFLRSDYLGDPDLSLDLAVRNLIEERSGSRPEGPVRLLTHLRTFGYVFNPVSFYYVFAPGEERLEHIVADITNTPWGERHAYVLDVPENAPRTHRFRFGKEFHVSPFMSMDLDYDWRFSRPSERLTVHMENRRSGSKFFDATLMLRRREISARSLNLALLRHPFLTGRVIGAIHLQALKLWRKRVPFHSHPAKRAASGDAVQ